MLPKVSVVVPIYKVENYLRRCVDSILNQSYTNLEVILVNDGSPDNCGQLIETYAAQDKRVKSFHKENGGLSDARNFGMKHVTGEYTIFVDSDDWLDLNMVEILMNHAIDYKADIVQSAFYYAYENYLLYDNRYFKQEEPPVLLNNELLMKELVINEKVKNFAWGKLFKTSLIKDLPFKKGVLFEDVYWAHRVMHQVERYVMVHKALIYYFQRPDSIVSSYSPRSIDILTGLKERHHFINKYYKQLSNESLVLLFKTSIHHYNLLLQQEKTEEVRRCQKDIYSYINKNFRHIQQAVKKDKDLLIQVHLFNIHPLINVIYLGIRKALRKIRIIKQPASLERVKRFV